MENLVVYSGTATPDLAKQVAEFLNVHLIDAEISKFADGETHLQIKETVRGADAFLIQSTCPPVNDNLMELLIAIDAFKRASAKRITAVIPYYGYARQDRKDKPRVPITAKLVADLLTTAGANRVMTIDLHAGQVQGFFNIPVDELPGSFVLLDYISKLKIENLTVVSPDVGGIKIARNYARRLGVPLAVVDKRRPAANLSEVMNVIGDIEGRNLLIPDDMVSTAGTLCNAAIALKAKGALEIISAATHPVFSGSAFEKIQSSPIKQLFTSNTIPVDKDKIIDKIKVVSVGELIAKAIDCIHNDKSVGKIF